MSSQTFLLAIAATGLTFASSAAVFTVTTADNSSTPADGLTSLLEAIESLRDGDRIAFNIPGDAIHYIDTPLGGYPFITAHNVTVDGYTQPGASQNTRPFAEANDAVIRIALSSISDESIPNPNEELSSQVLRRSRRMVNPDGSDIPGYGSSENAILAVLGGRGFTVRGLSFVGRHTPGSTEDPNIYAVALARGAVNAKVQGCYFGLRPDRVSVNGMRAAVTGFRHRVNVDGANVDTLSSGLVFGTDGDGVNDRAEGNLALGMSLALGLELPGARISGNRFNVFPDGVSFLNIKDYAEAEGLSTVESFENGRNRENTLIGTNGDGVSDAEERNVFGPSLYDHTFEFYGGNRADNTVVAGNFFNVGVDGVSLYPFDSIGAPDFFQMSDAGSVRLGSNGDGVSDDLEVNLIHNMPGDKFCDSGAGVAIVARANLISNCGFLSFPFRNLENGRAFKTYYANALEGPLEDESLFAPLLGDVADGFLTGTLASPNLENFPFSVVDVYLRDPAGAAGGLVVPGIHLGRFVEGSTQDSAGSPNEIRFPISHYSIPAGSELVAVVTYSQLPDALEAGQALTGPVSEPIPAATSSGQPVVAPRLSIRTGATPGSVQIAWDSPEGVFLLQRSTRIEDPDWTPVMAGATRSQGSNSIDIESGGNRYYRLVAH